MVVYLCIFNTNKFFNTNNSQLIFVLYISFLSCFFVFRVTGDDREDEMDENIGYAPEIYDKNLHEQK